MKKIKAYIRTDEENKIRFYKDFEVKGNLPKIGDEIHYNPIYIVREIDKINLDPEQGNDEVFHYDFYKIVSANYDDEETTEYIAIAKDATEEYAYLIGEEYSDPDGRWKITGLHSVGNEARVNIILIGEDKCQTNIGMESEVPIDEALYFLEGDE